MFIRFDYRCRHCGYEEERFIKKPLMDEQYCHKTHLGDKPLPMIRLPAGTRTHFRFADTKLKD